MIIIEQSLPEWIFEDRFLILLVISGAGWVNRFNPDLEHSRFVITDPMFRPELECQLNCVWAVAIYNYLGRKVA